MRYIYSICYPDKEEIDFFKAPINKEDVMSLVGQFDWATELKKEIEYYSPSLDFINLNNRNRIILSGIGDSKLTAFQVMYLEPIDEPLDDVFSEDNYLGKNPSSRSRELSIEESLHLLKEFLADNFEPVKNVLDENEKVRGITFLPDEKSALDSKLPSEIAKEDLAFLDRTDGEKALITALKKNEKESALPRKKSQVHNPYDTASKLFLARIGGPLLGLFFFWMALVFASGNEFNWGIVISGGIALLFIIGSIRFEIGLRKKK